MSPRVLLALLLLGAATGAAHAGPYFKVDGYGDARIVFPSDQDSWWDGGLGKLRWGEEDEGLKFAELVGAARIQATEDLAFVGVARIENYQKTFVDVIEAYARYRPVSTSAWRWSVKAGAFFAPISLENNEIGWTSEWTLTPSAINTWVGDELRTIGTEAEVEWRSEARTLALRGSIYGYNDPAGVLIAFHGWTLEDRPSGLVDRERLPDALAVAFHTSPPLYANEFKETDGRFGWYAGAEWEETGFATASVLYYDNRAEPDSYDAPDFGWRTRFWSVGLKSGYEDFVVLAQALWGDTTVEPRPGSYSITDFRSAYLLVGWYVADDWRLAARADWFSARENLGRYDEDGYALTAALSWLPTDWARITAEVVHVDSKRGQRLLVADPAQADETQFQLSGRVYF